MSGRNAPRPGPRLNARSHLARLARSSALSLAPTSPCAAALAYQRIAAGRSRSTPSPCSYMLAIKYCAPTSPCCAAFRTRTPPAGNPWRAAAKKILGAQVQLRRQITLIRRLAEPARRLGQRFVHALAGFVQHAQRMLGLRRRSSAARRSQRRARARSAVAPSPRQSIIAISKAATRSPASAACSNCRRGGEIPALVAGPARHLGGGGQRPAQHDPSPHLAHLRLLWTPPDSPPPQCARALSGS